MTRLGHSFKTDQIMLMQEGRMLIEYVTMNVIVIRKILKKYGFKDGNYPSEFSTHFSFNVDAAPTMTLMLLNSIKLEYDLTCPICLEFDLYALDWWTSLMKIMCLFTCFSDDLRWTKGY
ncbi:hypothetical protein Csa_005836 [Cucumis sativus]|nr:hypothetical protein Csa_005836 [Cucumis sativus]